MGFQSALGTALYSKLSTAAGTVLWAGRIYDTQAPEGVALPYVVFQHVAGGDTNISPSRIIDCEYRVECIAATPGDARSGSDYIETALKDVALTVTGFNAIACTQQDLFNRVDNVEGKAYYRKGAFYRIRQSA
jgi:hypothetical protein